MLFACCKEGLNSGERVAHGGAIADAQPDHLGRASAQNAEFRKIGVFGDKVKAILPGIFPDRFVGQMDQAAFFNVR